MFFLSESDINAVVSTYGADYFMDRLIAGIDDGFKSLARGEMVHSRRTGFVREDNLIEWMPVCESATDVVIKVVSYFPRNPEHHALPTIGAVIARCDFRTGQIAEIADGRLLTAMRTGAASAVASRYLAAADSATLGLVGCGLQSVTQAHALSRVLPIERVLAFDIDAAALKSLTARLSFLGVPIQLAGLDEIERHCDILCTATTVPVGAAPVIGARHLRHHVHINAVGADLPGKLELAPALTRAAFVATDLLDQARVEGECQSLTEDQIASPRCVELQTVVECPGAFESRRDELTIFDSTGIAMEDAIALGLVCELARQANIGHHYSDPAHQREPKNPYAQIHWPHPARILRAAAAR